MRPPSNRLLRRSVRPGISRGGTSEEKTIWFALVVQRVERMEELVLRGLLPDDELHVVEEQDVRGPEALPEAFHLVEPHPEDDLVHEVLGGQVDQLFRPAGARGGGARWPA